MDSNEKGQKVKTRYNVRLKNSTKSKENLLAIITFESFVAESMILIVSNFVSFE